MKIKDWLFKKCQACKKGEYVEKTLQDSWDGVVICNSCNDKKNRFEERQDTKDKK